MFQFRKPFLTPRTGTLFEVTMRHYEAGLKAYLEEEKGFRMPVEKLETVYSRFTFFRNFSFWPSFFSQQNLLSEALECMIFDLDSLFELSTLPKRFQNSPFKLLFRSWQFPVSNLIFPSASFNELWKFGGFSLNEKMIGFDCVKARKFEWFFSSKPHLLDV